MFIPVHPVIEMETELRIIVLACAFSGLVPFRYRKGYRVCIYRYYLYQICILMCYKRYLHNSIIQLRPISLSNMRSTYGYIYVHASPSLTQFLTSSDIVLCPRRGYALSFILASRDASAADDVREFKGKLCGYHHQTCYIDKGCQ